jgi:Subtilase family/S-layer homology domain
VAARRVPARAWVATAVAVLVLTGLLPAPAARAADPITSARQELSRRVGGGPGDFQLVGETSIAADPGLTADPSVTAATGMWAAKFIDARTGAIRSSYRTSDGTTGSGELFDDARAAALAALPVLERKADAPLVAAVRAPSRAGALRVAVWMDVDVTEAEAAVERAHPEVEWLAGRPIPATLEQARSLRAELWQARQAAYATAAEAVAEEVTAVGGAVAYVSTSAPLVFVDVPPDAVEALAERPEVLSLGLEQEWRTFMSSAGSAVGANWTTGSGDQGNGVRVAVVEYHNTANTGDLSGQVVTRRSTTGRVVTHIHPTWVAGAIASRSATWRGVAPGADIVSSSTGGYTPGLSTDRAVIAAADWAVSPNGGDADIVNASFGQDTATGAEEARRYFDSIGWQDGRLVVAASGNFGTFGHWNVVSPATGYNVLAVGGINDRNSAGTGDDVLWYGSNGASYRDPNGTAWNPHGDFNKPNLSAPAVSVRTANGTIGDGTSIASPIVAGIAAQLLARAPSLATWPEGARAVLMAGANRRTPMPGGGVSADHEGVGTASARWSNRVLDNGPWGGWTIGSMTEGQVVTRNISVVKGQRVKVALAWSSHTSGVSNLGKSDHLRSDLDLVVRQPNGATTGSFSFDNSYESVTVTASGSGTMRIEVRHDRFDTTSEPYGLAWSMTSPFSDVGPSSFYDDILFIAARGITTGCGSGRFCPTESVTRAQMATFLSRALNLPPGGGNYFDDDDHSPHERNINRIAGAGITTGCHSNNYCPDGLVRREHLATFLARALNLPPASRDYFDDDDGNEHEDSINRIRAAGITTGCGGNNYCPGNRVTRQQMAAFLHRALTP